MSTSSDNLHGHSKEKSCGALLLIDLINDLEFPGGDKLAENIFPLIENIVSLKRRAKEAGIPVIYVNDNFGKWRSDFRKLLEHCVNDRVRGSKVAQKLAPDNDDYFVLKPKLSGFYSTTLALLLSYLETRWLILAGVTGDQCILFTAGDAHMRDFRLIVPSDCVASQDKELNRRALQLIRRLDADITSSSELDLERMAARFEGQSEDDGQRDHARGSKKEDCDRKDE